MNVEFNMEYVSIEQFDNYLKIDGTSNVTVLASPFLSMIVEHKNLGYKTLRVDDSFNTEEKYDNIIIDIIDGIKYPKTKISHEHRWLIHAIGLLKEGGRLKARIPSYLLQKMASLDSGGGFVKRKEVRKYRVNNVYVDGKYSIVDLTCEEPTGFVNVKYNTGESIELPHNKLVILKRYVKNHYDYINSVDVSTTFEFQPTNGQRGYEIGQTFKQQFDHFCGQIWNKDHVIVKSNSGPYIKIQSYYEVNNSPTSRDVFHLKSKKNVKLMINKFKDPNFIDFVANLSYDHFGSICSLYKRLLFNTKILDYKF